MGRTLENKQQIVTEIKSLLNDSEMAVVLDYKGLTIKEMSDLRSRLQTTNGICKVTKNSLMRKAIDGDSNWNDLESLLTGTNAFVLIKEFKAGKLEFRADKAGIVHVRFGKASFTKEALFDNLKTLQESIDKNKPSGAKGKYWKTFFVTSTMGPSVQVDINAVQDYQPEG